MKRTGQFITLLNMIKTVKLPNKADITYSGESESESDDFGVYTLNGDGTVARIDCGSVSYELIY